MSEIKEISTVLYCSYMLKLTVFDETVPRVLCFIIKSLESGSEKVSMSYAFLSTGHRTDLLLLIKQLCDENDHCRDIVHTANQFMGNEETQS